ncbi:MAG TPA: TIGR00341 family protein [Chitinophagaceae bacterium]|nr:TIGR00341 family protein [Chitinophagaceae bacterium]
MKNRFLDKFSLLHEREEVAVIIGNVEKGVVFKGTNLWILIFAIFIASLGLNINSTAVIIGAMLISPLMGPIMGLGLSVGINDLALLKKSLSNYLVACVTGLCTSTIFFLISPLNEAHSEILARTAPNIYDVLIALFGGFAGIVATASKQKGNVIPGVAIATALMPPLCTAGYGLATFQLNYAIGAFYLFIINTVFIALSTFITTRLLSFPYVHLADHKDDKRAQRIIWFIVVITLLPSLYFGYDIVQQDRFTKRADLFVETEARFTNDYLLNKKIDAKKKEIVLTFGGQEISQKEIELLRKKLPAFDLQDADLQIHQGFAYLAAVENNKSDEQLNQMNIVLKAKEAELNMLQAKLDSVQNLRKTSMQVYAELKAQYPDLVSAVINPSDVLNGSDTLHPVLIVVLDFAKYKSAAEKKRIENWLTVRFNGQHTDVLFRR